MLTMLRQYSHPNIGDLWQCSNVWCFFLLNIKSKVLTRVSEINSSTHEGAWMIISPHSNASWDMQVIDWLGEVFRLVSMVSAIWDTHVKNIGWTVVGSSGSLRQQAPSDMKITHTFNIFTKSTRIVLIHHQASQNMSLSIHYWQSQLILLWDMVFQVTHTPLQVKTQ